MPVKIQIASKKMEGLRHWNQICTFSNPPSQGHSCEWEKPRTVALGAERTRNCCPGCRADPELLPWLQSGPLAKLGGLQCLLWLSHSFACYPFVPSISFSSLRMYHCSEVSLAWLSPVTWFVTLATRYMGWLRIERRSWRISFPLAALWPLR